MGESITTWGVLKNILSARLCAAVKKVHAIAVEELREIGFEVTVPQGAYYIMANCSHMGIKEDAAIARVLLERAKVAVVPGRSFYLQPEKGKHLIRLCYALNKEKLQQAIEQIKEMNLS